jgi:hypothetical protein
LTVVEILLESPPLGRKTPDDSLRRLGLSALSFRDMATSHSCGFRERRGTGVIEPAIVKT